MLSPGQDKSMHTFHIDFNCGELWECAVYKYQAVLTAMTLLQHPLWFNHLLEKKKLLNKRGVLICSYRTGVQWIFHKYQAGKQKKHKEQNPNAALGGRTGADNGLMANVNKEMLDEAGNGQCQYREQSEEGKQIQ